MALSLITYATKITSLVSPLPANEKFVSADANEIKTVVNDMATKLNSVGLDTGLIVVPNEGLRILNSGGSFYGVFNASAVSANRTFTLPDVSGTVLVQSVAEGLFLKRNTTQTITGANTQILLDGGDFDITGYNNDAITFHNRSSPTGNYVRLELSAAGNGSFYARSSQFGTTGPKFYLSSTGIAMERTTSVSAKQHFRFVSTGMEVEDSAYSRGLYYMGDYSANGVSTHGDRWITDKGYNDGRYRPKVGTNDIGNLDETVSASMYWQVFDSNGGAGMSILSAGAGDGGLAIGNPAVGVSIYFDENNVYASGAGYYIWDVRVGAAAIGLTYKDNYGSNFVDRSIIDKGFADVTYLKLAGGTMAEAGNIAFGTSTGSKIGTATAQKIGFWNATPVIQQGVAGVTVKAALTNLLTALHTTGMVNSTASFTNEKESFVIAVSDESTALTTGAGKITFRMPYAFTLTEVRASVTTAPTGSVLTVDINEGGTSILSTKLTIDASEKTSTTAATPAVISDASLADDAEMTVDIDGIGATVAGAGLKIMLIGYRT